MIFSFMFLEPDKRREAISALVTLPNACYMRWPWMIRANRHKI